MTQGQKFIQFVRERMREEVPDTIRIEGDALILKYKFNVRGIEKADNDGERTR